MATDRPRRSGRIDQPMERGRSLRPTVDSERFGAISESVARHIGSWAFIAWMTSEKALKLIAEYGVEEYGEQLFFVP